MFQIGSVGAPEQVWHVLTSPDSTRQLLFGVSLQSSWALGSSVTGWLGLTAAIQGEVLFSEYPNRLSYVLSSGPDQPEVFIMWDVRECGIGSLVRLSVVESDTSDSEELESVWQPVVTALQALLAAKPA